jgi:nucleoside-diphosphate-sugar epimerase
MQTILGANGVIGQELSKYLPNYTSAIRQVSRNPKKVNASDETVAADLLDYKQTEKAIAGSDIVYLVAGLKYDTKTWQEQWPKVMRNTIDACKKHNSKLVFFDNVYAYGLVKGTMTEATPFNPSSKKGEVRARIATMLLDEINSKNLDAMIVRSADFYGPDTLQSVTHSMVTVRLKAGKSAQWIGDLKAIHSFTYTPDAGKTTAMLGNMPQAFNQTWHALTSHEILTGEQYIRLATDILGQPHKKPMTLKKWSVRLLGVFVPVLREFVEMMYQFENDYIFDSSKATSALNEKPTPYKEGITSTLR